VAARIEEIGVGKVQADLAATASILAGLVLNRDLVKQILRRDIMRESVIYQDILEEGEAKGRAVEATALVIRQLTRKLGNINSNLLAKIEALSLERVELLGEDLLDFTAISDLEQWLA
jgi:predicted transposase YdaD